jgi:predicted metal-binding membrane protein
LAGGDGAWAAEIFWWLVMIAAMMFPLVLGPIRITAARSLWHRRHRAIGGFLAGYLGPWMLFGVVAYVAVAWLQTQTPLPSATAAAAGFATALLWQSTTLKRRALRACHRILPIAPSGWRANRDCLRYGWVVGSSCLMSCWALMLACMLSGHSLPAMVGVSAICWAERNTVRPRRLLLYAVIGVLALAYALLPGEA